MPAQVPGRWFRNTRPLAGRDPVGRLPGGSGRSKGGRVNPSPASCRPSAASQARGAQPQPAGPPRAPEGLPARPPALYGLCLQLAPRPRLGSPTPAPPPNFPRLMRKARAARIVHLLASVFSLPAVLLRDRTVKKRHKNKKQLNTPSKQRGLFSGSNTANSLGKRRKDDSPTSPLLPPGPRVHLGAVATERRYLVPGGLLPP